MTSPVFDDLTVNGEIRNKDLEETLHCLDDFQNTLDQDVVRVEASQGSALAQIGKLQDSVSSLRWDMDYTMSTVKAMLDEQNKPSPPATPQPGPALRGTMVQDRLTGEGPWIVCTEPGSGGRVRIYDGHDDLGMRYPETLVLYEPPAEPEPKEGTIGPLGIYVAMVALTAALLAPVIPALAWVTSP